ncbi:MAG: tripartite tricarboxylate transporter substrate binding protein [Rubrivivax sp.]|nr:tripartite tricarboxylate transporter substrate binding protein [Rubrivivax sp.]
MKRVATRTLAACVLACMASAVAVAAASDTYPAKIVKIVVPYPPGGPYDTIARVVAQKLGEAWGQPFVVENRAGANGGIGASAVAKSPPDGYTLLMGGIGPNAINGSLYPSLPYNAATDFAPVIQVLSSPNVLVVNPSVKVHSVAELQSLARTSASPRFYASAGAGSSTHLFAVMFAQSTKLDLIQVSYKGDAPAVMATIAGDTPCISPRRPAFFRTSRPTACAPSRLRETVACPPCPTCQP